MTRPNLFIVGAPRCGSTALFKYLRKHPEVYIPREKELGFFAKDIFIENISEKEYLNLFKGRKEKILGDADPFYLYSKQAPKEIKQFNPEAKIIIILRNPVFAMHSLYNLNYFQHRENISFEKALKLEKKRKEKRISSNNNKISSFLLYRDIFSYSKQIERYLNIFERKNIKFIIFEEFIKNPKKDYKKILDFLEINNSFLPLKFKKINSNSTIRSKLIHKIRQSNKIKILKNLPRKIRRIGTIIKELNKKEVNKLPLKKETKEKLKIEIKPEIKKIEKLIQRDLSIWSEELEK